MRDVNCDFDWILGLVVCGGRARTRGWERALGCPGAQPSITQHYQVYMGYGSGCPGARSRLPAASGVKI